MLLFVFWGWFFFFLCGQTMGVLIMSQIKTEINETKKGNSL